MGWVKWLARWVTVGLAIAGAAVITTGALELVFKKDIATTQTLQCFIPPGRFVQITDVQDVVHEKEMLVVFRNNERMYLKPAPGTACSLVTHDKTETLDVPKLPAVQEEESI